MNNVNKTMYIPLYSKAYVSQKGLFLKDKTAETIWTQEAFPLKGKAKSKWLAYYLGIRSAVFDDWTRAMLKSTPNATVVHLGCGMDSRHLRIAPTDGMWYDIDFSEVIDERKRYYTETPTYRMIAGDVRTPSLLENIPATDHAIVIAEGISMYLTVDQLKALTDALCRRFKTVSLLMDCYSTLAAKLSKLKNPVNTVGVVQVYGIDDPTLLSTPYFRYIKQHAITPAKYIDELHGMEKRIFKSLYAGYFSKRLYRLYEFQKVEQSQGESRP